MKRTLLVLLLLTGVYAMVLASFHPWDLLFGALVSGALIYAFRQFVFGGRPDLLPGFLRRCAAFFPFVWAAVWDIVAGTWQVALVVLHLRPLAEPGVVEVPVGERTPTGVAISALVTTLSPGAFLVEADDESILIHLIDASDPEAFRRDREDFYQRYQKKVFP
ncbi:MAG: Na+/H+ antiporter subunit E [Actinomycetota bacterium]|nr:Na+/H+ antiporter subunit E [Actinomycetota bacterium]